MRDVLDLDDLQGLVARGYGKLRAASYLLLHVESPGPARRLLNDLVNAGSVTTAAQSRPQRAMNVAFTAAGLLALTESAALPDGFGEPYVTGMVTDYRTRLLGDVEANNPEAWLWGGPRTDPVHVVILLYAADGVALDAWRTTLVSDLEAHGLHLLNALATSPLSDREPFGFRDGISQPILAGLPAPDRDGDVVRDGEFVLGYTNEYSQRTERPLLRPSDDPHAVLPRDPDGSGSADLGLNGSYLVFRQLDQDVAGFKSYLAEAATVGGQVDEGRREYLAAKIVGRWRGTGAPLTLAPEHDDQALAAANDFGYAHLDAQGLRCPVAAHIRRANPRDSLPPGPGTPASRDVNRRHRLLRRGRAYGNPDPGPGSSQRGLHFQCFNTNLARQYEFVQHSWVNAPSFAGLVGAEDPLVGPRIHGPSSFLVPRAPVRERYDGLPQFGTVQGGAYFFMPGIKALRFLTSTTRLR
jgi:Dyp-type peroxidase family